MNKIEELIAELCPDGVEYRKLGEICQIKNGRDYKHWTGQGFLDGKISFFMERVRFLGHQVKGERCSI